MLAQCIQQQNEYKQQLAIADTGDVKYPRDARYDSVKRKTDRYFIQILKMSCQEAECETRRLKRENAKLKREIKTHDEEIKNLLSKRIKFVPFQ